MTVKELKEYLAKCPDSANVYIQAKPNETLFLTSIGCAITGNISMVTLYDSRYDRETFVKINI